MGNYLRMVIVLSVITLFSGLALGGLNELTYERAQNNILKFKKIPAVATIYEVIEGKLTTEKRSLLEEELLSEKKFVDVGEEEPVLMFVIKKENKPYAVTFERFGQGFGGALGVMVGYELDSGKLVGIGITTLAETPGVGTRVTETGFTQQFQRMPANAIFKVKKDGGHIDAIAGATVSSRAVATAVAAAKTFYNQHQDTIATALNR
ncbi:MAG: FMN-binding protein [Deltaproteobacteria bacterium]|jgi:Na+-translocating ferredoxin:NAD+ oxidoreductase subunit G|nr:FMN-binding protein [Deltaproteobacteria bacterium]MBT6502355.1 FMN-binding protein [Deltaproteobacteria bacterium]MBT6611577.1 FMN-binding protein [Deltaproteobacteria bacterium]MBT7155854.1 FMN-binding protein [Deltaproteobacteria bacterium]MBT7711644.1 FMN-binding protein [Deltaproteobacteria bacterium]